MDKKPRRFLAPLLVLAAIIVAVGVYLLVTMPDTEVDIPADDATPEQVVAAYMEALNSKDCDTAQALTSTPDRDAVTATWCHNVKNLDEVEVSGHFAEDRVLSLRSVPSEVVNVPVTFNLTWRFGRDDGSMDEGPTSWGYQLARSSPTEPWRISDQGNG